MFTHITYSQSQRVKCLMYEEKTNVPRGLGGNFSAGPWEGFAAIRLCLGLHCSALLGLSRQIDQGPQGFPVWSREERGGMRSFWQPTSLDTGCQG